MNFVDGARHLSAHGIEEGLPSHETVIATEDGGTPQGEGGTPQGEGGDFILLVMSVRASAAGLIIGKAGQNLTSIIVDSGASIRFQNVDETVAGVKERGIIIRGTKESVAVAFKLIMLRLQSQGSIIRGGPGSEDAHDLIQWSIPQSSAGLLIGKQGAGIKHINERSGCWVKIAHPEESITRGERLVYIRGPKANIDIALEIVKKVAGGRAVAAEAEETNFAQALSLPNRAVTMACKGLIHKNETETDFDEILEEFSSVRVDVDNNCFSGISESKLTVFCEEPGPRVEAIRLIEKRVEEWRSTYTSPEVTPRGDEGILDSVANMSKEMNAVVLVSEDACDEFLFPVTLADPHANVFANVLKKYKCVMNKNLPNYDKDGKVSFHKAKRISVTGSLNGLVSCVVQMISIIHEKYPSAIQLDTLVQPPAQPKQHSKKIGGVAQAAWGNSAPRQQIQPMMGAPGTYAFPGNDSKYQPHQYSPRHQYSNTSTNWRKGNRPQGFPGGRGGGGRGRFDARRSEPQVDVRGMDMFVPNATTQLLQEQSMQNLSGLAMSPLGTPTGVANYSAFYDNHVPVPGMLGAQVGTTSDIGKAPTNTEDHHMMAGADGNIYKVSSAELMAAQAAAAMQLQDSQQVFYYAVPSPQTSESSHFFYHEQNTSVNTKTDGQGGHP